ncbi:efflux RND transporter periplasmic adaptor subunit [Sulfuriflexus sp.]|uniref:efflux RND transporter periplasmic adaptor subunit n=1 Tax=Sulfuriflexus sp. TaxID=2015443 RepID=UPI0028CE763D|nr:efflux RND transporter periplasmic adaptor subunit [Sulfuriflexus sp.]MDT8404785.1 efflux RND transporter periplasmic adaptor subunit [Sulfuriflexus sp.]
MCISAAPLSELTKDNEAMPQRRTISVSLLVIITAGVAGFLYWQNLQQQAPQSRAMPPAVIAATEVTEAQWEPSLQSVGSLVATNGIDVSTEVNGIVSEVIFTSGQPVEQGQVLIRLDDSVDVAALEALRAERRLAEVQFNRASDLLKKRVTSKSEFDEARARFDAAVARVKQQQAVIKRKIIHAPFTGLAGIRQVSLGEYLEAGASIVSLQALDPIYADYTLPERYLTRVKSGQVVKLKLDALPGEVFSGSVSAVNPGVDTGTRTLKVRATLDNAGGMLRPGMFAGVTTITDAAETVLTLPKTAISFNTYGSFVFVISENDTGVATVKRTAIKTGEARDGRVQVSGLSVGTRVVRAGLVKLRDGMPVKIDNQVKLDDKEISSE